LERVRCTVGVGLWRVRLRGVEGGRLWHGDADLGRLGFRDRDRGCLRHLDHWLRDLVDGWRCRRGLGDDLIHRLLPEEELRRIGNGDARGAPPDELSRLVGSVAAARSPRECLATLGTEPGWGLHRRRALVMWRRDRELVALLDQADLAEELVNGPVRNVHAGEAADAFGLLAKVFDRRPAAIAGQEVRLELARRCNLELSVEIAAQSEEAASHSAISR
jgi:hypothetical protein